MHRGHGERVPVARHRGHRELAALAERNVRHVALVFLTFVGRQDQSYLIPAGGTVNLIYTAQMPAAAGIYANSARAYFGTATTPTVRRHSGELGG